MLKESSAGENLWLRKKHPFTIRWCHWVNFPLIFIMIWSGLLIYWANDEYALHWGDKVFFHFFPDRVYELLHLKARLAEGMSVHFTFMWLFGFNGVLYVLYNLISGEWRQLMPDRNSLREARDVVLAHFWLAREPEHSGNFNGMQRVSYLAIIGMGFGSLMTGLAIYKPAQLHWLTALLGGYAWARIEHFGLTLGFLAFFLVHVFEVARAGWNNFRSMVTGYEVVKSHE